MVSQPALDVALYLTAPALVKRPEKSPAQGRFLF